MANLLGVTPFRVTGSPSRSGYQMEVGSSAGGGILRLPSSMLWRCLANSHAGLVYSAQLL